MKKYFLILIFLFTCNTSGYFLLKAASYNTKMLPAFVQTLEIMQTAPMNFIKNPCSFIRHVFEDKTSEVAKRFADQDIVAFQEVMNPMDNYALTEAMLTKGFQYYTERTGEEFSQLFKGVLISGGIKIFSKHQIIKSDYLVFPHLYSQSLSAKGAVYVAINFHGKIINFFSLHAQSSYEDCRQNHELEANCREQRTVQLHDLKNFIDGQNIPEDQLIIVMGDFNIDNGDCRLNYSLKNHKEFNEMLHILSAKIAGSYLSNSLPFSMDTTNNDVAGRNYLDTVRVNLDHILSITKTHESRNHPSLSDDTIIWIEKLISTKGHDISDHHIVFMQTTIN